jgi:hypothetical protein
MFAVSGLRGGTALQMLLAGSEGRMRLLIVALCVLSSGLSADTPQRVNGGWRRGHFGGTSVGHSPNIQWR